MILTGEGRTSTVSDLFYIRSPVTIHHLRMFLYYNSLIIDDKS
jgi:hypothetical protein